MEEARADNFRPRAGRIEADTSAASAMPTDACGSAPERCEAATQDIFYKTIDEIDSWTQTMLKHVMSRSASYLLMGSLRTQKRGCSLSTVKATVCPSPILPEIRSPAARVPDDYPLQPKCVDQIRRKCRFSAFLTFLLASAVVFQLRVLSRLQRTYEGLRMIDAFNVKSKALKTLHVHDGFFRSMRGRRKHNATEEAGLRALSPNDENQPPLSKAYGEPNFILVSLPIAAETVASRLSKVDARKRALMLQNQHKNTVSASEQTSSFSELKYWEHLSGGARPALAALLEKSLAQTICPFPDIPFSTHRNSLQVCTVPPIRHQKYKSSSAEDAVLRAFERVSRAEPRILSRAKLQAKDRHEAKNGRMLQAQSRGLTASSNTLEGPVSIAVPYSDKAKKSSDIHGLSESVQKPLEHPPSALSTVNAMLQTSFSSVGVKMFQLEANLKTLSSSSESQGKAYFAAKEKLSSLQAPADIKPLASKHFQFAGSIPPSGKIAAIKQVDRKQHIPKSGRENDSLIIYEAPHYLTKIMRHMNRDARPIQTAMLDSQEAGNFVEETASMGAPQRSRSHPVILISRLQEYMDNQCAAAHGAGGPKRAHMRLYNDAFDCFDEAELDFSKQKTECVDSCGHPIICRGVVKNHLSGWEEIERRLNIDPYSLKLKALYCVNSRLQARLNELCGSVDRVWRVRSGLDLCVKINQIEWHETATACVDECGGLVRCYGAPRISVIHVDKVKPQLQKRKKEEIHKFCVCDEATSPTAPYQGCQTVTRSGRTCQKWNTNEPHAHLELTEQDHNFCRDPHMEGNIWCYTTDPQVRFDYCTPLGLKQQYIQPKEKLDIVLAGRDLNAYVSLRIYTSSQKATAICGAASKAQSTSNFFSFLGHTAEDHNLPRATIENGAISALTWEGVSIAQQASGAVILCGCNYWYMDASESREAPCLRDIDYTILLGKLQVAGPVYPGDEHIEFRTWAEKRFTIRGAELSVGDMLMVISGTNESECMRRNQFTVRLDALGSSRQALEMDSTLYARMTLVKVTNQGKEGQCPPLQVPTTGRYLLCWSGARQKFSSAAVAKKLLVTGIDSNQHFYFAATFSEGEGSLRRSTIFIRTYKSNALMTDKAITIHAASTPYCQGVQLGHSTRIAALNAGALTDAETMLYRVNCVLATTMGDEKSRNVALLDVCAKVEGRLIRLGQGTVGNTYLYSFSKFITPAALPPAAPDGVFTYKIDAYSSLGRHWRTIIPRSEHVFFDFTSLFVKGAFPKALSFWVNHMQGQITAWVFDPADAAPELALIWKLPNAATVALDVCFEHAHLYVITSKPSQLHVYDVSDVATVTLEHPIASLEGSAQDFVNLCSVVLIYAMSTDDCKPLVLLLDCGSGFLSLYDANLTKILSTNHLEGMTSSMSHPSSLSCTPRSSPSSERFDAWDCVIADPGTATVTYFRVNPVTKQIVFLNEYYGESVKENGKTNLQAPHAVIAHRYTDKTLIYVAEARSPDMHMLVVNPDEDSIRFESFLRAVDSHSFIRHIFIIPIQLSPKDRDDVLLATFREGDTGPQLQYGLLSGTGQVPEFFYQPREWYGVGDTHVLKPLAQGGGTLENIHNYSFDTSSTNIGYISSIADIDRLTGAIRLSITHIETQAVSVKVLGVGLVNRRVTRFEIRVTCRDGYYVKQKVCVKCEAGTYNSMLLVAENPKESWSACRSCPSGYSTVGEGSVSANQCQCQKGYYMDESTSGYCIPCPPGTWKDTVSNMECRGKCPAHSSTQAVGATTPEERRCKCNPGYYYSTGHNEGCIQAPEGHFSPGGYRAELIPCPIGTSHDQGTRGGAPATTLRVCECERGYSPASEQALKDPTSAASSLRAYLKSFPRYADLQGSQVCVKCERDRFKDAIGSMRCERCPKSSFSSTMGASSIHRCSQCAPGYFQTGDPEKPCRKCLRDHFCVGSDPIMPNLARFANKVEPCPRFTKTVLFAVNDHPLKCMCKMGFEILRVGLDLMVTCTRTRLNYYKDIVSNKPGTPCQSNTVTAMSGSDVPQQCACAPGLYLNKVVNACEPCPERFYCLGGRDGRSFKHLQPVKCPRLTSTHELGAKELSECLCDKGYQRRKRRASTSEHVACTPCPQNAYKDWVGNGMCRTCGENSGTGHEGATSAAQCLCYKGYYYNFTHLQCIACSDPKKFCPGGEEDCDPSDPQCVEGKQPAAPHACPKNTRIPAGYDAASSISDCKCEPGFAFKSGDSTDEHNTCVPCPPGFYKPSVQNAACNSMCGASATSFPGARSQSQCFCEEGTFRVRETCHLCPTGGVCAGGLLPEAQLKIQKDPNFTKISPSHHVKPYAKAGFLLTKLKEELDSPSDWQFIPCPIQNACLGRVKCVETMTEYLCSECKPGFTSNFSKGDTCTSCPSMSWNISAITLYYLGILLFNLVMTYMNVAAGFNRKSIHSIVIKIASNFLTCMSIVGVLDFNTIALPHWLTNVTTRVTEQVTVKQRSHWLSVDCLLRKGFRLSYADSFFYTMLFYALLPVALPIVATAIMYVLLKRVQAWYKVSTMKKLNLIYQAERCGLVALSQQLRDRCTQDRVFLIFRYIPLPGESRMERFTKFMEDMIPIYVTVLFFLHSSTTFQMLSLLDCFYIDFGRGHKSKYFLRAAMSVKCEIGVEKPYFKYLALGSVGLCTWSIGIPLSGFMVLYMKRKSLYSTATRLKYGFLHNGFLKKYWYWETVAFARKLLVLLSTSAGIIQAKSSNGSRIWMAALTAIVFLIIHLIAQPFDKRSYLTLDRLETHSMGIWTVTCIIMAMMIGSDFGGNANVALLSFLALLVILFLLEVAFSLMIAYFDNIRAQKTFFTVPVVGRAFQFFARLSEKRRAHEPVVIYDEENEVFQLVAAKRQGWHILGRKTEKIHLAERDYFIKVMAETLWFAVAHMKLNVIPGAFLEFILILGMTIHKIDESSEESRKSLQAIADGDLSQLAEWSKQEHAKKEGAKMAAQQKRDIRRRLEKFYQRLGKGLYRKKKACYQEQPYVERVQDLEGTASADESASTCSDQSRDNAAMNHDFQYDMRAASTSGALSSFADGSVGDAEDDAPLFINKEELSSGVVLSDLYLALLKLQQKDSGRIGYHYEAFRNQRLAASETLAEQLVRNNSKLKLIRLAFQSLITSSPEELQTLGIAKESFNEKKEELAKLKRQIHSLNTRLQELKKDPGKLDRVFEEQGLNEEEYEETIEESKLPQ